MAKRRWHDQIWAKISSADTWSWLFSLLPRPVRQWLRDNSWGPGLAVLGSVGIVVLGWLSDRDPWELTVGCIVAAAGLIAIGTWCQRSVASFRASHQPFTLKPISGPEGGMFYLQAGEAGPMEPHLVFARLEIESKRFLRSCTATVVEVSEVERHTRSLMPYSGHPRELFWTPGSNGVKVRDLTPGVARTVDVAVLDQTNPTCWEVAAADNEDRPKYPDGWFKVKVIVASESEDVAVQTFEGKIALGKREYPPPPLVFYPWKEGDENRVRFDE